MTDETNVPDGNAEAAPTSAGAPTESPDLMTSLDVTSSSVVRAIVVGALAYAFTWVAGLVFTALVILMLHIEDAGSEVSWLWLLQAPGQLIAVAFGSPAVMSVSSGDEDFMVSGSLSSTAMILTMLAIALFASFWRSRRDEATLASRSAKGAVTHSVVTAATFVAVGWLLALVLKLTIDADGDSTSFHAAHFQFILFGMVGITVAALLGRRPWNSWESLGRIPLAARDAWRAALTHLGVFSALAVPAGAIWLVIEDGASLLLVLPLLLGNLLVYALTLGHLGALGFSGVGSFLGETSSGSDSIWLFSEGADKVLLLLIPFAVVGVLAGAAVLHTRGEGAPRPQSRWVAAALVYGAVGGGITLLGTASSGVGASFGGGGSASFGPAAWFCLLFAVWGLLTELVARLIGPPLTSLVPAKWMKRMAGEAGAVSKPTSSAALASAPAASTGPATPMDPRSKKVLMGVGGLIGLLVVAAVGVSIANRMFFGPEQQAEAYFSALADGDAKKALDLARLDYSADERLLLTNDILKASASRITDVEVGEVETYGDIAEVSVEYSLDGAEHSQEISLKKSGSKFGVFNDWELEDPGLGALYVSAPSASGLVVNGKTVDISGLEDGVTLAAFPGTYEVSPTAGSKYLTFDKESISVAEDEENLEFEVSATSELATEVSRQADEFVAACIAKTEADPDGCPNTTYGGFDLEDVTWTLDVSPEYTLSSDSFDGMTFETATPGKATIKATEPGFFDGDAATKFTDTVDINLSGSVSIEGDTVTIDVEDYFF